MVLAIGVYDADALPSRWSYWAELQTPLEILKAACTPRAPRVHPFHTCASVRPCSWRTSAVRVRARV